jgi:hypothetical protein
MGQTARFQETLRRMAIFDEAYAEAGSTFNPAGESALEAKTAALL